MRKRRRCPFCRCLFLPDARTERRQWACTKPNCQAARRRETQRSYREHHPAEPSARRLRAAIAAAKAEGFEPATPRAPPATIVRFPWDELRDEISPQGYVITLFFVRLVLQAARDESRAEVLDLTTKLGNLLGPGRKDETAPRAVGG